MILRETMLTQAEATSGDSPSSKPGTTNSIVQDKASLIQKLGKKRLTLYLPRPIEAIPPALATYQLCLSDGGRQLTYDYDTRGERTGITSLLSDLRNAGIRFLDLDTTQSSLEDIFVSLVRAS